MRKNKSILRTLLSIISANQELYAIFFFQFLYLSLLLFLVTTKCHYKRVGLFICLAVCHSFSFWPSGSNLWPCVRPCLSSFRGLLSYNFLSNFSFLEMILEYFIDFGVFLVIHSEQCHIQGLSSPLPFKESTYLGPQSS